MSDNMKNSGGVTQAKEISEVDENEGMPSNEQFNFVETEKKILDFWNRNDIFKKSLNKTKDKDPYIFYDGPPFATGLPHHGHLVANTLKDVVPRYFTMKGYFVDRRFGWDCHGLPIEQEIDKKFEMSAHDFVAKHGLKKYNDECRGIVQKYTSEWEKTISRLGRWVDFKNNYKTMDLEFMESVWWVFKQAWDKGLIYKGNKVVPFSTALGTGLSNFEATSNYQNVQDPAITILLKLKDEPGYISAWTTTPWTLPSNLALCVNEDIDYVKVRDPDFNGGIEFYIAKERLEAYSKKRKLEVIAELKGKEMIGKRYEPLFPYFKELADKGAYKVISDAYVTTTDGTGIVHIAPAFGEDDNRVMKEHGMREVVVCPVDDYGRFTSDVTDYAGQYVKDADKNIVRNLKERWQLYEQATLVHSYPFCPRTDTPLIYKTLPQWYLAVELIKEDILNANKQINWVPEHIKEGRFGKWLENARDWAISRNRMWGNPLPIWINDKTEKMICVGSREELEKVSGQKVTDLHREFVDEITFSVPGEEGVYKRIPEVLDCWFESGSMPYAQIHYPFENKTIFEKGFPAEYIAEGIDQTRGWFYTLTVLSAMLYKKPAFKNVIVNGLVQAADGRKMSKRLRNYTPPDDLMDKFGADALRLFLINSPLVRGEDLCFTDDGVKEVVRRTLLPWYNAFKFFQVYSAVDGWSPEKNFKKPNNILDKWLISKLNTLIKNVNREMDAYRLYNVVPELLDFIEDLTNWYIRLNRRRFWESGLTDDKNEAFSTLYTAIKEIATLMAPFAPFLSEYTYQELKKFGGLKEESIHLMSYPVSDESMINKTLEDAVGRMSQVVLLGRQKRNQVQIKVKTPLSTLTVIHRNKEMLEEISKLEEYIKIELNIKKIDYSQDEFKYIRPYAKPNSPVLGKRLGKNFGKFTKLISELKPEFLEKLESGENIVIDGETFAPSDILVFREAKEGTNALSNRLISIDMDCTLNETLISEGLAREVVNRVQKSRKEMDLNVANRIEILFSGDEKIVSAIKLNSEYIKNETLTVTLNESSSLDGDIREFDIDGLKLNLIIKLAK